MFRIVHIHKPDEAGYYIVQEFKRSTRWERFWNPSINEWFPIRNLEVSTSNQLFATIEKHLTLELAEAKVTKLLEDNVTNVHDIVKVYGCINMLPKMLNPVPVPPRTIPFTPQRA